MAVAVIVRLAIYREIVKYIKAKAYKTIAVTKLVVKAGLDLLKIDGSREITKIICPVDNAISCQLIY